MRGNRSGDDSGTATVEFVLLVVGVLLPITYMIVALSTVLAGQGAATHAVREAGRVFVRDSSIAAGEWRARQAAEIAFADRGLALPPQALTLECSTPRCLQPGGEVAVFVDWDMPLPWVPARLASPIAFPIRAQAVFRVDEFRPSGA